MNSGRAAGHRSARSRLPRPVQGRLVAVLSVALMLIMAAASCVPIHGDSWVNASVAATPTGGPAPLLVHLDGSGSSGPSPVETFDWDFGDGSPTESGVTVDHVFAAPGTYTVRLLASGRYMLSGSASVTVTVD